VPPLLQMAGHGGIVSRKTANEKLTKLYWPSRKLSQKRLIVLLEPRKLRGTTKKNSCASRYTCAPPPATFKFVAELSVPLLFLLRIFALGPRQAAPCSSHRRR